MHLLRTSISWITVAALALAACGGDDDAATPPATAASATPDPAADAVSADTTATETEAAPTSRGTTYTASDICTAIDPADVAAQIAPVSEIQRVDDKYCTIALDREGMGNMLNISIEQPIPGMGMDDPAVLYDATVKGRGIIAGDVEPVPVDGIGDQAAAIPGDAGDTLVVLIGGTVAAFDPFLSDGQITTEMWRGVLTPAFARL